MGTFVKVPAPGCTARTTMNVIARIANVDPRARRSRRVPGLALAAAITQETQKTAQVM